MSRGTTLLKLLAFAGVGWALARWRESHKDDARRSLPKSLPVARPEIETSWVPAPTGPVRVLAAGDPWDEPAFLLVHGLGGSAEAWRPLMEALPGVRVAALDLPGHGESESPFGGEGGSDEPPSVDALAGAVTAAADGLGLRRFVLGAHSLGAELALAAAAKHPRRVTGLFLVDPSGDTSRIPERQVESLLRALEDDAHGELEGQYRQFLAGARAVTRETVLASLERTPEDVLRGYYAATLGRSQLPDLDRYREAGGKVGAVVTPWNDLPFSLHHLRRDLPVNVAHEPSHWLMMDEPELLARTLMEFAGEVGAVH